MRTLPIIAAFLLAIFASLAENRCSTCSISDTVEHKITYTNKDTRSEARHGHLYINGNELPDVFTSVVYREKSYKFHQRADMWGSDGYFPVETETPAEVKAANARITIEDLNRGWYIGKELLSGTPSSWLHVTWNGGSAFVVPEKVVEMAKALNLKKIQREAVPGILNK